MLEREKKYVDSIGKINALITPDIGLTGNLAGIAAVLKDELGFFWVGFYLVRNQRLEIGPYQGPLACIQIEFGKGVCGQCWKDQAPIIVHDVNSFNGHIACNPNSKSEIVVPVFDKQKNVSMILDIDSDKLADFGELDEHYLVNVAKIVEGLI